MECGSKDEQLISIHGKSRVVFGRNQSHVRYEPTQTVLHLSQSQNVIKQLLVNSVDDLLKLCHELLRKNMISDSELRRVVSHGRLLLVG